MGAIKNKWYMGGLHFECNGCGNCCAGPAEGYIWITPPEIERLARFLNLSEKDLRRQYLKRVGFRTSIIEESSTNDCIFLKTSADGKRGCAVYPVRPNQCRTWPFWTCNIASPDDWNQAAVRCPGINRGQEFTAEQIEAARNQKTWWE